MLNSRLVVDDERDAVDDVEHGRVAGVVGRLDRDQVRLRRDAEVPAAERVALGARLSELPAMMPATCVPWPKPSPAVVAPGDGDDVGDDARLAVGVLEVRHVAGDAGVDDGDADAAAGDAALPELVGAHGLRVASGELVGGRPVLWTRVLSVRPRTCLLRASGFACLAGSLTARPWMSGTRPVTLPPWARDERLGLALRERRLELHDRGDLAVRGLLGHRREARLRRRGRLGHRAADGERHDRRHEGDGRPATPAVLRGIGQFRAPPCALLRNLLRSWRPSYLTSVRDLWLCVPASRRVCLFQPC